MTIQRHLVMFNLGCLRINVVPPGVPEHPYYCPWHWSQLIAMICCNFASWLSLHLYFSLFLMNSFNYLTTSMILRSSSLFIIIFFFFSFRFSKFVKRSWNFSNIVVLSNYFQSQEIIMCFSSSMHLYILHMFFHLLVNYRGNVFCVGQFQWTSVIPTI